MADRVVTPRELAAEHLRAALAQVKSAERLLRQHEGTLTAADLDRLHELADALDVAAENVTASRDGLCFDADGRRVWGLHAAEEGANPDQVRAARIAGGRP